jgi:hypothetical protein
MPESPIDEYQARLDAKQSEFRERRDVVDRRDDSLKRRLIEDRRKTVVTVSNDRRKGPRRDGERRISEESRRKDSSYIPSNDRRREERRVTDRREYVTTNYSQEKLDDAIEEKDKQDFGISTIMFLLSFIVIFGSIIYVFYTEGNL